MSQNLDPINNLPPEVFELVVAQCQPATLRQSHLVSPDWCSIVSNSKQFIEAHECRFEIIDGSKYSDLHGLDPSKFRKLKVTSKRLVDGKEVESDSNFKKFLTDEHIQQMQKFSPYLTHLELNDLMIEEVHTLLTLLQFIKDCSNLRSLDLESLEVCSSSHRVANPLQQIKIDNVRVLGTFSILKHLTGLEINNFELFGVESDVESIQNAVDFLNSIDVLNEIKCDGGMFLCTSTRHYGESLQLKFKWRKADVMVRKDVKYLPFINTPPTTINCHSIANFIGASDDGAELSVLVEGKGVGAFVLFVILKCVTINTNIKKLTIVGDRGSGHLLYDVNFKSLPRAVGVEHFIAKLNGRPNRPSEWPLESLLKFCPNAQIVEITGIDFEIRAEKCLEVMKNVKSLSIDSWTENADVGELIMPKLTSLKIESVKSSELVRMQQFIANNMHLRTLLISKLLLNIDGEILNEHQLKQKLIDFNPELEIHLENIINL